jgi:hypothetical protein
MKPNDLSPTLNSNMLNEHLYKKFGVRVKLEENSRERLEDFRNRLRTKLAQTESNAMFNDLLDDEQYQKDKLMVGIINQRLKEMLGEGRRKVAEKAVSKAQQKAAGIALAAKKKGKKPPGKGAAAEMADMPTAELKKFAGTPHKGLPKKKGKKVDEAKKEGTDLGKDIEAARAHHRKKMADKAARDPYRGNTAQTPPTKGSVKEGKKGKKGKPDFLDFDNDNDTEELMTSAILSAAAAKDKKAKSKTSVRESHIKHVAVIQEGLARLLREDEEGKAKDITAGADMVNDFTGWMQRVGQYQTKSMIELADSIRSNFGQAESEAFKTAVQPALEASLTALTQSREQITRAVATLAGEEDAAVPMGAEQSEFDQPAAMDQEADDAMSGQEDEFAASDAAAGGAEVAGRELRESRVLLRAKKLAESNTLMRKLAGN